VFWDLFGEKGHPVRTTVSEMGPLLLARMLELNDVQEGVLNIVFKVADADNSGSIDIPEFLALFEGQRPKRQPGQGEATPAAPDRRCGLQDQTPGIGATRRRSPAGLVWYLNGL
jgi:hypothetical protein